MWNSTKKFEVSRFSLQSAVLIHWQIHFQDKMIPQQETAKIGFISVFQFRFMLKFKKIDLLKPTKKISLNNIE